MKISVVPILIIMQIALCLSVNAAIVLTDVEFVAGNETYKLNATLNFESIILDSGSIIFNSSGFYITSTNSIEITLAYITNDITNATVGERVLLFNANTASGNVIFSLSGFVSNERYTVSRNGTELEHPVANALGYIVFSNNIWSEKEFEITKYATASSSGVSAAAFNGSTLINDPWNTTFSPFTDLFEEIIGNGHVFYLVPLCFVTVALYVKVRDPVMVSMFMLTSGVLLSGGNIFFGALNMGIIFIVFAAIGIAGLFVSLFIK